MKNFGMCYFLSNSCPSWHCPRGWKKRMKSCLQTHDFMYNIFDHSWTEKKEWNHVFRHMISLFISDRSLTADYICQQSVSERCLNKNILTAAFLSVKMCVNCMCIADKAWNLPIYVLLWIYVRHLEVTANFVSDF